MISEKAPARKTALVTGATGLLGNNLVRLLVEKDFHVKAMVRSRDKAAKQFTGVTVEVIEADITNLAAVSGALTDVDIVFHTAAHFRDSYKGGQHRNELYRINVQGTVDLLSAAYLAGVRKFIHTSSIAVLDGKPGQIIDESMLRDPANADDYYRSKILSDEAVLQFLVSHPDMWAAMVLPGWMHGPGDVGPTSAGQMVLDFLKQKLPFIVPGDFSLVDARDVAEAMLLVAEKGTRGERYLAAGRSIAMEDLFSTLQRISGIKAPARKISLPLLYGIAVAGELWARLTKKPILLSLATVRLMEREAGKSTFDNTRTQRQLGLRFRPTEQTLRDEIEWYRTRGWLSAQS
ncbi:MAG: SDR family oxidoreductase [Bryobacteraceae bacterium]|nr:SDR family oxidoreductase [Bryobacteraceae bacterium]